MSGGVQRKRHAPLRGWLRDPFAIGRRCPYRFHRWPKQWRRPLPVLWRSRSRRESERPRRPLDSVGAAVDFRRRPKIRGTRKTTESVTNENRVEPLLWNERDFIAEGSLPWARRRERGRPSWPADCGRIPRGTSSQDAARSRWHSSGGSCTPQRPRTRTKHPERGSTSRRGGWPRCGRCSRCTDRWSRTEIRLERNQITHQFNILFPKEQRLVFLVHVIIWVGWFVYMAIIWFVLRLKGELVEHVRKHSRSKWRYDVRVNEITRMRCVFPFSKYSCRVAILSA